LNGPHRTAAEFLANLYQHKRALYQAWEVLRHCFPLAALWHFLGIKAVMEVTAVALGGLLQRILSASVAAL